MNKPLCWGLLGTSFISGVMIEAIRQEGRSKIKAVAGRNAERLNDFASQRQITTTFTDYDALITDPDIDIIYIALPNHCHTDYVIKAAQAGKAEVTVGGPAINDGGPGCGGEGQGVFCRRPNVPESPISGSAVAAIG